jgi:hypothetical protein
VEITAGIVGGEFSRPIGAADQSPSCDDQDGFQKKFAHAADDDEKQ